MNSPHSNNSQHNLTAQQAADLVRDSYAAHWANAHHGTEIRGGYERPDGDATVASEFAETSGSPDDI
jgi:hypothetical protein